MLIDVLSGLEEVRVAVAYEDEHGRAVREMPGQLADLEACRPIYETLPGWPEDLTQAREWADLPPRARDYVLFLSRQIGIPITIVSVGPERRQTIVLSAEC
jgi:adenylosuccinate synthase